MSGSRAKNAADFNAEYGRLLEQIATTQDKTLWDKMAELVSQQTMAVAKVKSARYPSKVKSQYEDVAVDAAVHFLDRIKKNEPIDSPSAYLNTTVKHGFDNILRSEKRHRATPLTHDVQDKHRSAIDVEGELFDAETHGGIPEAIRKHLDLAISKLDDKKQVLANIYYIERPQNMVSTTAQKLGINPGSLKRQMSEMRTALHHRLEDMRNEYVIKDNHAAVAELDATIEMVDGIEEFMKHNIRTSKRKR